MPAAPSEPGTPVNTNPVPLSFRQLLLRTAIEESRAPRFLLSLFDADEGEHEIKLDVTPLGLTARDDFVHTPTTAFVRVEGRDTKRWAHLVCGMRATNETEMVYFSVTLDERGLRAAYRTDEDEPKGDEVAFSQIELSGMIPPELVSEFAEEMELPQTQIA